MKRILCYGDSNTWGLIPGSNPQQRYSIEKRWTGILQNLRPDLQIIEEGLCGRTTVFEDALRPGRNGLAVLPILLESHKPLDGAVVMLGTNDCKTVYRTSEYTIGKGIELCLKELEKYIPSEKILLVSPILLGEDVWRPDKDPEFDEHSVEVARKLKDVYKEIAERRCTAFLAASDYVVANDADCEHLDEEGHRIFAKALSDALSEIRRG